MWLHNDISNSEIVPPGYNIVRKDRSSRGGGLAIILKDTFNVSLLEDMPEAESLWLNVSLPGASLVGVAYRPPSANRLVLEAFVDYVSIISRKHDFFIFAGDFNLPQIDWSSFSSGINCINSGLPLTWRLTRTWCRLWQSVLVRLLLVA